MEWNWKFRWRRNLFVWESEILQNLTVLLEGVELGEGQDEWRWRSGEDGLFSVKSCYKVLEGLWLVDGEVNRGDEVVFGYLWKCRALSKVLVFVWTTLLNQIPTRVNLAVRGVLGHGSSTNCVLCGVGEESVIHLFLHCDKVQRVWQMLMGWLDVNYIIPHNLFVHLDCWTLEVTPKKLKHGFWMIWKTRNDAIFNNGIFEVGEVVGNIKVLSWIWSLNRLKIGFCLYYEWCWNPRSCLARLH